MATLSITARTAGSAELIKTQALAVLMPERKTLAPTLKALDKRLGGTVTRSLQNGHFTGSTGSQLWLPGAGSVDRVLLVGKLIAKRLLMMLEDLENLVISFLFLLP